MTRLAELTTMRVGGEAAELLRPRTTDDLVADARRTFASGDEWLVLGGGSNVVVSDDGFDGTVIRVETRGIERLDSHSDAVTLRVQAGESWDGLVAHAVAEGWAGIEALSGIPGSVGAAPIQNIGAYGQELSSALVAIEFLDYLTEEVVRMPAADLELGYRTSALKQGRAGIVLSIELSLSVTGDGLSQPIAYDQLASALGVELGARVTLASVRETVLALRARKGMVLDPADPDSVSCGSFFTNPIVSESFARALPADAPRWPVEDDPESVVVALGEEPAAPRAKADTRVKLSAAWLIERAGIRRSFALPGSRAAISSKHTLAITNTGGATADDVAELARFVQTRVFAEFGVRLQPEPNLVGLTL